MISINGSAARKATVGDLIIVAAFGLVQADRIREQPHMHVHRWRIYECGKELHLVCEVPETGRLRMTTPVGHWDTSSGKLVTESGRVYQLNGPMAEHTTDLMLALIANGLIPNKV